MLQVEPQRWSLPPEPDLTVSRLRCECHNKSWMLTYAAPCGVWIEDDTGALYSWLSLLTMHTELIDATKRSDDQP